MIAQTRRGAEQHGGPWLILIYRISKNVLLTIKKNGHNKTRTKQVLR